MTRVTLFTPTSSFSLSDCRIGQCLLKNFTSHIDTLLRTYCGLESKLEESLQSSLTLLPILYIHDAWNITVTASHNMALLIYATNIQTLRRYWPEPIEKQCECLPSVTLN